MSAFVVDASVVAAAFFDEEHADAARALLAGDHELLAPDLIYAEFANVAWKRFSRKEIDTEEATDLLRDLKHLPILIVSSAQIIESALEIALRTGRTAYDSLYVAAALASDAVLVTADRRLVNALRDTALGKHVALIGDTV